MTNERPDERELRARKPYEPPRIVSREPLEVMAGFCVGPGAKSAGDGLCNLTTNS